MRTEYTILVDGEVHCKADWLPLAIASWKRLTGDWNATRKGVDVELLVDGRSVFSAHIRGGRALPWPVPEDEETNLSDVAAAILQLCRAAGIPPNDLAAAMTESGLPTTRSRLKSISTIEPGRHSRTNPAELVVLCYAAIGRLK